MGEAENTGLEVAQTTSFAICASSFWPAKKPRTPRAGGAALPIDFFAAPNLDNQL